jgi:hypothetical protein
VAFVGVGVVHAQVVERQDVVTADLTGGLVEKSRHTQKPPHTGTVPEAAD